MMQIGIDIVEMQRIATALNRGNKGFLNTVYTAGEVAYIRQAYVSDARAAGMWAAKEAVVKAFGIGFSEGISFHDVEVLHTSTGQPHAVLAGKLASWAMDRSLQVLSLSISHAGNYAVAAALVGPVSAEAPPRDTVGCSSMGEE